MSYHELLVNIPLYETKPSENVLDQEQPLYTLPFGSVQGLNILALIIYLTLVKIAYSFILGIQARYLEQQWFKKIFYQDDGALAAVFSEAQQHRISNYEIRRSVFWADIFSRPMSRIGHSLFVLSLIVGYFSFQLEGEGIIGYALILERVALALLLVETLIVLAFRIPIITMSYLPGGHMFPLIHKIK